MNQTQRLLGLVLLVLAGTASAEYVRCESIDFAYRECRIDTRGDVQLVDRHSRAGCHQGRDWGVRRGRVWVANGCRATFASYGQDYRYGRSGHDYADGYDHDSGRSWQVRCESRDYRRAVCGIDTTRGVRIVERLSRSACREGYDWGMTHRGVWVANGCRAVFESGRGYRGGYNDAYYGDQQHQHGGHCRHDEPAEWWRREGRH